MYMYMYIYIQGRYHTQYNIPLPSTICKVCGVSVWGMGWGVLIIT